jgi:hypothetical protein
LNLKASAQGAHWSALINFTLTFLPGFPEPASQPSRFRKLIFRNSWSRNQ